MPDRRCVTPIGETFYTRGLSSSAFELQLEAWRKALADAGLTPPQIDGVLPTGVRTSATTTPAHAVPRSRYAAGKRGDLLSRVKVWRSPVDATPCESHLRLPRIEQAHLHAGKVSRVARYQSETMLLRGSGDHGIAVACRVRDVRARTTRVRFFPFLPSWWWVITPRAPR